ncbi:hypothetical protein [Micromonospora sp. KLBMP9576]|uniref:hypothetical protein n=1 Tax=Micromonospora sp. KLBMP9576 TaxID=3424769 RepID=UPI003D8BE105
MTGIRARRPVALVAAGLGAVVLVAAVLATALWAAGRGPFGAGGPQPDEVLGTMRDASDQSAGRGAATRGGTVLAIPATAAPDFWALTSVGAAPTPEQVSYAPFTVPTSAVASAGGVTGALGRGGRFSLRPVSSGAYLLCYASGTGASGYQVQGCREALLRAPGRIDASRGEAGFRVMIPDAR